MATSSVLASTTAQAGFMKKNGASRTGSLPISRTRAAWLPAHAEDAMDGKQLLRVGDGHRVERRRCDGEVHD